jgi:hypothetical protein
MIAPSAPVTTAEDERRRVRGAWPVRRFRLGEEPGEDLCATTTAEERLAMMWPLALDAFSLVKTPVKAPPRTAWPVKVRRLGEPEVD